MSIAHSEGGAGSHPKALDYIARHPGVDPAERSNGHPCLISMIATLELARETSDPLAKADAILDETVRLNEATNERGVRSDFGPVRAVRGCARECNVQCSAEVDFDGLLHRIVAPVNDRATGCNQASLGVIKLEA